MHVKKMYIYLVNIQNICVNEDSNVGLIQAPYRLRETDSGFF